MDCLLRVPQKCTWPHFCQCIYVFYLFGWWNGAVDDVSLKLAHPFARSLAGSRTRQFKLQPERSWKLRSAAVKDVQPLVMRETDTTHGAPTPHIAQIAPFSLMFPIASKKKSLMQNNNYIQQGQECLLSSFQSYTEPAAPGLSLTAALRRCEFFRWSSLGRVTWYMLLPAVFPLQMDWQSSYVSVKRG